MLNEVSPHLRGNLDAQTLAVELLPLLVHIITPTLRPVSNFVLSSNSFSCLTLRLPDWPKVNHPIVILLCRNARLFYSCLTPHDIIIYLARKSLWQAKGQYMSDCVVISCFKINTQLFSTSEKQQLADLINTMISYNLTYHQERTSEGLYNYSLDPYVY